MSETTTTETEQTQGDEQKQGDPASDALGEGGKKALEAERTARKAAEKAASDLQAELAKINQANESAVEKAQREAKEAQDTAAKATAEAIRFRVAAKYGLTDDDADLFLHGTDAETLERQAAALVARTPNGPKPDPSQGAKGGTGARTTADSFADFFRTQL